MNYLLELGTTNFFQTKHVEFRRKCQYRTRSPNSVPLRRCAIATWVLANMRTCVMRTWAAQRVWCAVLVRITCPSWLVCEIAAFTCRRVTLHTFFTVYEVSVLGTFEVHFPILICVFVFILLLCWALNQGLLFPLFG